MARPIRPSADQTRTNILQAAKILFLHYGFHGVSVKQIAEAAHVNTNLIFHHFNNKETLWVKVKELILDEKNEKPNFNLTSAQAYFKSLIDYRFDLFEQKPDLVRLLQWQQLTENEAALVGNDLSSPQHWILPLKKFRASNEIKADINVRHIMLFIIFSTHAPFMQQIIPFTKKQKLAYKNMLLDMCCQQFLNKKHK